MEANILAKNIVNALESKKAHDIDAINIEEITVLSSFFVICSGTSTTHIKAMADEVEFKIAEFGIRPLHKEGYDTARWILIDYGTVVVHIFHHEDRDFYKLERLWSDGVFTNFPQTEIHGS